MDKQQITITGQKVHLSNVFMQTDENRCHGPNLELTIKAGESVELIDDLHDACGPRADVTCLVEAGATLTYNVRMLEGLDEILDPSKKTNVVSLVSDNIEKTLTVRLVGEYAQAEIKVLCLGRGEKSFRLKTLQDHLVPNTTSNLVIRSVLDDQAKLFAHNTVKIVKGAQKSSAEQENKAVLLSRKARATAIPILEIEANDVRCTHGAAVSQFDQEQFFYLQSRGLSHQESLRLLMEAFLS